MKWLFVAALAACGGGSGAPADGGGDDAQPGDGATSDSATSDAPTSPHCDSSKPAGPVTVWNLQPGLELISHDASGAFFQRVHATENSGQIDVPGCGAITVADDIGTRITIFAVEPGETIWATFRKGPTTFPPSDPAHLVVDQPIANVQGYNTHAGARCYGHGFNSGPAPTLTVAYNPPCVHADGKSTVLVYPTNSVTAAPFVYAVLEDVSLAQATMQAPLHVTSWITSATHHLSLQLAAVEPASKVNWSLYAVDRGLQFESGGTGVGTGPSSTFEVDHAFREFGDAVNTRLALAYPSNRTRAIVRTLAAPLPLQVTDDLTTGLLPFVHSPQRDSDPVRPTLSWTVDSNVVTEDLVRGYISTQAGARASEWRFIAPPGTRSIRLPELPADLVVTFPSNDIGVALDESTLVPNYKEARQNPIALDWMNVPLISTVGDAVQRSAFNFDFF